MAHWAALKGDCVAYIIFSGGSSADYPQWYREFVENSTYEDEYRYWVAVDITRMSRTTPEDMYEWSDVLVEGYDVILRNSRGEIRRTNIDNIDRFFVDVADGTLALTTHVVEYVIFDGHPKTIYPDWFVELYNNYIKSKVDTGLLTAPFVVLRKDGFGEDLDEHQLIDYDLFKKLYFYHGNGIPWDDFNY